MSPNLFHYTHIVFDLDNTVYTETDYLFESYRKIAQFAEKKYAVKRDDVLNFLKTTFIQSGRLQLFDKVLKTFDIPPSAITDFLDIMRTTEVAQLIEPLPEVMDLMTKLRNQGINLYIITNGNPIQQKNKVKHINWHGMVDNIIFIYANEYMPKPDPTSFQQTKIQNHDLCKTLMIGDSESDFLFAKNVGIDFLNINQLINETHSNK
jgi:HAD superfamily hydrolase (TIGR01549 family)